jgi:hypothetical protein
MTLAVERYAVMRTSVLLNSAVQSFVNRTERSSLQRESDMVLVVDEFMEHDHG